MSLKKTIYDFIFGKDYAYVSDLIEEEEQQEFMEEIEKERNLEDILRCVKAIKKVDNLNLSENRIYYLIKPMKDKPNLLNSINLCCKKTGSFKAAKFLIDLYQFNINYEQKLTDCMININIDLHDKHQMVDFVSRAFPFKDVRFNGSYYNLISHLVGNVPFKVMVNWYNKGYLNIKDHENSEEVSSLYLDQFDGMLGFPKDYAKKTDKIKEIYEQKIRGKV